MRRDHLLSPGINLFDTLSPTQQWDKMFGQAVLLPEIPAEDDRISRDEFNLNRWWRNIATGQHVGQMFEHSVGWQLAMEGWEVDLYGARMGIDDKGRDIVASKGNTRLVAQCKYTTAPIAAAAIYYLYGTAIDWKREHHFADWLQIAFFSHSQFMPDACAAAKRLNIQLYEYYPFHPFPAVKCHLNRDGRQLYHLPWQQNYRRTIIRPESGDCLTWSVFEAAQLGFSGTNENPPDWVDD
jgi:hypothetical protein